MLKSVKYILAFCVITACLSALFLLFKLTTSKNNADHFDTDKLVVGMMSGWAPFMVINQNGEFEGFDVDVAQKIADKLGKKLEIRDFGSLSTLLVAVQQNKVDFAMSGLDITQKRLETMKMVAYTGQTTKSFFLLFWKQIPKGMVSIKDLQKIQNPVVCVEPGSAEAKYLDQFTFINQKSLSKIEDMALDVKYGKSLAMFIEPQAANRFIEKNPELKNLEIPVPRDFQTFGKGIAFSKKAPFCYKVKQIVENMRQDGSLQLLEKKWGLEAVEQR